MITYIIAGIITFIISCFTFYKKGKNTGIEKHKQEVINNNNELKKEFEKVKLNDVNKVKEAIKKTGFIFILLFFTTSCIKRGVISTACPKPIVFSKEFTDNLMIDIEKANSFYINQLLLETYNINQQLKICNK